MRDRASDHANYSRQPVVESAAPRLIGLDIGHASRASVYVTSPGREPSSPLPTLVCNWAAALFALGAVFAARRYRSRARTTAGAEVLPLPPPEAALRQVSRAA